MSKKRILIYGFNARMGSLTKESTHVTFAQLMKVGYTALGYDVFVGFPPEGISAESLRNFEKVFVGVSSPTSIASDKSYIGSYIIGNLWGSDKLVLFFDDSDIRKTFYGVNNWIHTPFASNIFRPGFKKRKLWYDPILYPEDSEKWAAWHANVMRLLVNPEDEETYPTTIIPAFPWVELDWYRSVMPPAMKPKTTFIDPSSIIELATPTEEIPERAREWVSDNITSLSGSNKKPWIQYQHTNFPVTTFRSQVTDAERVDGYRKAWGMLDEPPIGRGTGWWSKYMPFALKAGTLYVTDPLHVRALGPSFNLSPAGTEHLTMEERDELAKEQFEVFTKNSWSKEQLRAGLEEVLRTHERSGIR